MTDSIYLKPPFNYDWNKVHKLTDIVGTIPIDPERREELLSIYFLVRGKFEESNGFCTSCLTPTPSIPKAHHLKCCNYRPLDVYPEPELPLGLCPDCKSEFLHLDSSLEAMWSEISCQDCGFSFGARLCEEDLIFEYNMRYNL